MQAGTVELSHNFFVKERNAYANWRSAFWREMFQNSVDAILEKMSGTSGEIHVTVLDQEDGCIVTFDDNGVGMNADIINNVFMKLGETTKGGGTTGGFGRARILTHFSMPQYVIETQGIRVVGEGPNYSIDDHAWTNGCKQTIHIDGVDSARMKEELEWYLGMSQLPGKVFINGERFVRWSYRRQMTRTFSGGVVYVNKSGQYKGRLIVRVNGTYMFHRWIDADAQVLVEITPEISREVLTSNRDGLTGSHQRELDAFIAELAADTKSALKNKLKSKTRVRKGTGTFFSRAKAEELANKVKAGEDIGDEGRKLVKIAYSNVTTGADPNMTPFENMADVILEHKDMDVEQYIDMHDVVLIDDTENPRVRAVFDSYDPLNWRRGTAKGRSFNIGGTKYKLLTAWRVAVQECLVLFQDEFGWNDVVWGVGWYFSDDALACHKVFDGTPYFALNPVGDDGKMRYRLRPDSYAELIATAAHEVIHIVEEYHNERFASMYTTLMKRVVGDTKGILRKMKEAVAASEIPLDMDDDWN